MSCSRVVLGSGWGPGGEARADFGGIKGKGPRDAPREAVRIRRASADAAMSLLLCIKVKGGSGSTGRRARCSGVEHPPLDPQHHHRHGLGTLLQSSFLPSAPPIPSPDPLILSPAPSPGRGRGFDPLSDLPSTSLSPSQGHRPAASGRMRAGNPAGS